MTVEDELESRDAFRSSMAAQSSSIVCWGKPHTSSTELTTCSARNH